MKIWTWLIAMMICKILLIPIMDIVSNTCNIICFCNYIHFACNYLHFASLSNYVSFIYANCFVLFNAGDAT
jgi:hypothetical protein